MSDGSSDDEDYDAFHDTQHVEEKRYPLHDCCEFEDLKALRVSPPAVDDGRAAEVLLRGACVARYLA